MPLNGAFTVVGSWDNQGSLSTAVTFDQEKTFDNIVALYLFKADSVSVLQANVASRPTPTVFLAPSPGPSFLDGRHHSAADGLFLH